MLGGAPRVVIGYRVRHRNGPQPCTRNPYLCRYCSLTGLFGSGNYFAENVSKADQYCVSEYDAKQDKHLLTLFVARVLLGSAVGSRENPVVPSAVNRVLHKMGIGASTRWFRKAEDVAKECRPQRSQICRATP